MSSTLCDIAFLWPYLQSCKMSILLHGAKSSNKILPQEKHVNCDNFGTKRIPLENKCWSFCQIGLVYRQILCTLCKFSTKKGLIWQFCLFLPKCPNIFTRIYPSYPWHFATLPPLVQSRLRKSCKSYLSDKYVHCAWTKHVICLQTRT